MSRRLAAILMADVVGYSRLMEVDEAGTLAALKARHSAVIEPVINAHGGRIAKVLGDGVLAEFASAVGAVEGALDLQRRMSEANAELPEERRLVLRIGINLGDIIVDGDDIYGDGVNVASRLEALAEPGGIAIAGIVHESVGNRIDASFADAGEHRVKNIARPIRVWRSTAVGTASAVRPTGASLPLPEKPSIAVLPFVNMSSEADQEYFADGISEDLITELSKFRSLLVISRNSAFSFKGQPINLKEISSKLGVRYIVEGSVRRAGNRLRITAQLIDAVDDVHLWADRYNRQLEDIFDVQDEVVKAIISAIEPQLLSSERSRALRKPPESLDAWESYQRGLWHTFQYKPEDRDRTLAFFQRAIELDPTFASAYAGLGYALYVYMILGVSPNRQDDNDRAFEAGKTAVRLDERDPFGWVALSRAQLLRVEHEAAVAASDTAISLNPNFALAHFGRAHALWHAGRPGEAVASHDEALRLSPLDPMVWAYLASKAIALVLLGQFEEAIALSQRSQRYANAAIFSHLAEISALGNLRRSDDAREAIRRAREKKPDLSIAYVDQALPITDPRCRGIFLDGLRMAGVPE
ncbi:MAG TPA: adenylate/guanylate cyclase domain-containing protein [Alphaproteobacteria bacterium]|nr:adenylate/guanylate cyclase domain-containing protein [Alphaproteobacteria bacterium]